jgi:hypothetical protein
MARDLVDEVNSSSTGEFANFFWRSTRYQGTKREINLSINNHVQAIRVALVDRIELGSDLLLSYGDCRKFGYSMQFQTDIVQETKMEDEIPVNIDMHNIEGETDPRVG